MEREYKEVQENMMTKPLPVPGKDMDSILKSLETGVSELFTSERYLTYLQTMAKFHNYSFNNTLLIAMQRPDATLVAGYGKWKSMGRHVNAGEKGITIIAPANIKRKQERVLVDQSRQPILDENGQPKTEEVEVVIPKFKATTVFNINQTDGEPIETLAPEELTEAVKDYELLMRAIIEISPVPIRFDEISGNAKGYYHTLDKEIVIQKGMSESQTIKTALHESGHTRLHDREIMESMGIEKDRLTKEVEAESVAYCVCSAFDLDTSDYSFPYIAGWSSNRETKELKASMDTIRKTSGEMIDELEEKLQELVEEKKLMRTDAQKEELVPAMEAARYYFLEKAGEDLTFYPDGTHPFLARTNEREMWHDNLENRTFYVYTPERLCSMLIADEISFEEPVIKKVRRKEKTEDNKKRINKDVITEEASEEKMTELFDELFGGTEDDS